MEGARQLLGQYLSEVGDEVAADPTFRASAPLDDLEQLRQSLCAFVSCNFDDPSQVEDVVQETLIRLLSARCTDERRMAYAQGIARHLISDLARRTRRERSYDPVRLDGIQVDDNPLGSDPLRRVSIQEEFHPVQCALTDLCDAKRDIIDECFFRNRTCAEIARRDGVPAARLRKVKSRALHDLREGLHQPAVS